MEDGLPRAVGGPRTIFPALSYCRLMQAALGSLTADDFVAYFTKKAVSNDILPSLTTLSNSSLNSGHIQTSFKSARFQPLFKKPVLDNTAIKN
ncbi:unnamed protein product [Boreogadus saida]